MCSAMRVIIQYIGGSRYYMLRFNAFRYVMSRFNPEMRITSCNRPRSNCTLEGVSLANAD